ncbi:hypothetical protein CQA70_29530, partial [Klebsiella pneumoniae]
NHAAGDAAMESEAVLPEPKNLLLVLDEGHHLPARREIQEAEVVVANHAAGDAAMESEAVLPEPKNLLLVLDEGHHLP